MHSLIEGKTVLTEVRQNWAGVDALSEKLRRHAVGSMGLIGGRFPFVLADAAQNLPFLHAYGVLDIVLRQLEAEGYFTCARKSLGHLLAASESAFYWKAFALIDEGHKRRNEIAHEGQLLNRGDCWRYIDAIRDQLLAWGIIEPPRPDPSP